MKSQNIIELSAKLLNIEKFVIGEDKDQKVIDLLVIALNNVLSEIAEEYIPFIKSEKLQTENGVITYDKFSERVKEIISTSGVKFNAGIKGVEFCVDGEYEIKYSYIPKKVEIDGEFDLPTSITERVLAYGVAGEYALMTERYSECVNYDNKFISGLKSAKRVKKERKMPFRGWI